MTVRVQTIWNGTPLPIHSDGMGFRALLCGGIVVYGREWNRRVASTMLDILAAEGFERKAIRFRHV